MSKILNWLASVPRPKSAQVVRVLAEMEQEHAAAAALARLEQKLRGQSQDRRVA